MIIVNLIQNVALLVALAAAFQVIGSRLEKDSTLYQILSGILFGGVGLVGMMTPLHFMPGIIFDGRSIILSVSGLFGGPVVAVLAAIVCSAYRLWLGGAGALVGVAVIAEAAALGVLFHFLWKTARPRINVFALYLFGLLVHAVMLALMLALPGGAGYEVLRCIGLPIITIYPVATMLVCQLFQDYERQTLDRNALRESEAAALTLNHRLKLLQSAIAGLAAVRSMDELLVVTRTAARRLVDADGATFVLREGHCCFYVDEDAVAPLWKGRKFSMETCISGWVMQNDQPAFIEDVYHDARIPTDMYRPTFVRSLAIVPVRTTEPLGAIGAYWAETRLTTDDEKQLLEALAHAVAVAMQNIRSYELLERRVADRTAQLEAANRELEAFSYSVSHDLRAPLRAVDGYVRILLEDYESRLDDEGKRICSVISDSAREMGRLIDDLLAFSRISRSAMQPSPVDMATLANAIYFELTNPEDRARIAFHVDALPWALGDPALLRHVWMNLLGNAIKFSSKKERAVIEILGHEDRDQIIYTISDNGAGFDMQYQDKLFGVFQRLHSTKDFDGSGVGLAIVQRIVNRHGGRVWAEGETGKGASFHFTMNKGDLS